MLNRVALKGIVLFLLLIGALAFSANSQILERKITLNVMDKPVIEVLHEIEKLAGTVFSFNSELIDKNRRINLDIKDKTLNDALQLIFSDSQISFKEVGNQIVLFPDKTKVIEQTSVLPNSKKETPQIKEIIINDTVYRYINTTNIKVYDTVRYVFFDTIRDKPEKIKPDIYFELGVSPLFYFPVIKPASSLFEFGATQIKKAEKSLFSWGVYGNADALLYKARISAGMLFTSRSVKYNYNINESYTHLETLTERTWITQLDTSYYTIKVRPGGPGGSGGGTDTTWHLIYEKIPVDKLVTVERTDSVKINTNGTNRFYSFSVPITIGFDKKINEKLFFSFRTGPQADILLAKKGRMLNPETLEMNDLSILPFITLNVSWLINTGFQYIVRPNFALSLKTSYLKGLQTDFGIPFPVKKYNQLAMFSIGGVYRLK